MQLSADEISQIIKKQIQNFDRAALVSETSAASVCLQDTRFTETTRGCSLRSSDTFAGPPMAG